MKILILSDPNSIHTIKWVRGLAKEGIDIFLFGLGRLMVDSYLELRNVKVVCFDNNVNRIGGIKKLKYLAALSKVKEVIHEFNPDILHAHYATSYGLLGALTKFKPFIISVWGSDVYQFPNKSLIHKFLLKYNLSMANLVLSTSKDMAEVTKQYTSRDVIVTPFGIDVVEFCPMIVGEERFGKGTIIGTIKSLEYIYGIDYLLDAFKLCLDKYPHLECKLVIVGGGSLENYYKEKAKAIGIFKSCFFIGKIKHEDVPYYHNLIDIPVFLSLHESFGVSILEAAACGKPVIVSDAGGLPEIVEDKISGFVVPAKNSYSAFLAIEKLLMDKTLRRRMGQKGRERVLKEYNWENNLNHMLEIYKKIL